MSMHMIHGVQVHGNSKSKPKKLDMAKVELEWRRHNKDLRRNNMHRFQFETLQDYVGYITGKKPKVKKEFKEYEAPKSYVCDSKKYPSLKTSDVIPESCARRETTKYTGSLIVGIATMHKSNAVPVMRGTDQAEEISRMSS